VVYCGIESESVQTKDYAFGICCFFAMHEALRGKSRDWLARNQDNLSVERYVNCCFSEQGDIIVILSNVTCSRHHIAEKLLI